MTQEDVNVYREFYKKYKAIINKIDAIPQKDQQIYKDYFSDKVKDEKDYDDPALNSKLTVPANMVLAEVLDKLHE